MTELLTHMDVVEASFIPKLFVTLTYTGKRWSWDDVSIDIRKYIEWLMRKLNVHMRCIIGYELFENSHIHLVIFSPDMDVNKRTLSIAGSQAAWRWGRVKDVQTYDLKREHAGIIYTTGHDILPMAGEVFCPEKGPCRRGHCPYPKRLGKLI